MRSPSPPAAADPLAADPLLPEPVPPGYRPALRPALRVLRRDRFTLQVGTDPERALAYSVRDPQLIDLVCGLDGRRTLTELAAAYALEPDAVAGVVAELAAHGIVGDARDAASLCCPAGHAGCEQGHPASGGRARSRRREVSDAQRRLAPDLSAWDLLEHAGDGGRREWSRRAEARVSVLGTGRVALAVGVMLGAAGIGRIDTVDDEPAKQSDRGVLALTAADLGQGRRDGLRRRLAEMAPSSVVGTYGGGFGSAGLGNGGGGAGRPDVVVLAGQDGPDRLLASQLSQRGVPHLVLTVSETLATLGPFVVPGVTVCVRCLDLRRADADPAWPLVVDRLAPATAGRELAAPGRRTGRVPTLAACDDVLTTVAAAHAVLQVTAFLRAELPPSADATIEFRLPSGMPRRRSWQAHPDCGCGWGAAANRLGDNGRRERPAP